MTGYIDDADIEMMRRVARPFSDREIDVGYRARNLPPYFGRFGRTKAEIGERLLTALRSSGFRLDISLDPAKSLAGARVAALSGKLPFHPRLRKW